MLGSCYCLESSVVGCLLCHAGCSTDKLASSLAFHPPSPPSYVLRTAPDGTRRAAFDPLSDDPRLAQDWGASLRSCEVDEVTTRRGNTVCVLRMRRPGRDAYGTKATIVVSHGNALDAALFIPFATHIATQLDANVSVYDYSGYGASSGRPRVEDCKADIEAVVTHHVDVLGCDPGRIVLYGQSIGSGPTCHYAALAGNNQSRSRDGAPSNRHNLTKDGKIAHKVGGVVLISPIMSGLSVISPPEGTGVMCTPACVFKLCDVFKNFDEVAKFACPALVVHGRLDDQVPCSHGVGLHALLGGGGGGSGGGNGYGNGSGNWKHPEPYWVKNAGHQNVYDADPAQFLARMRRFVSDVSARASQTAGGGGGGGNDVGLMPLPAVELMEPMGTESRVKPVGRGDGGAPVVRDAPAGFAPQLMSRN